MKKQFDPTSPHNHQCPNCWKSVYCRGANCEIPERAECLECQRAGAVERYDAHTDFFRRVAGYRRTVRPYEDRH